VPEPEESDAPESKLSAIREQFGTLMDINAAVIRFAREKALDMEDLADAYEAIGATCREISGLIVAEAQRSSMLFGEIIATELGDHLSPDEEESEEDE